MKLEQPIMVNLKYDLQEKICSELLNYIVNEMDSTYKHLLPWGYNMTVGISAHRELLNRLYVLIRRASSYHE
jgi:hypothetical protein